MYENCDVFEYAVRNSKRKDYDQHLKTDSIGHLNPTKFNEVSSNVSYECKAETVENGETKTSDEDSNPDCTVNNDSTGIDNIYSNVSYEYEAATAENGQTKTCNEDPNPDCNRKATFTETGKTYIQECSNEIAKESKTEDHDLENPS